ncbi:hypothetical protein [Paenibacillus caui]|uniref:hypothetical protein n=1 Tax=Paenibacillus caui TaxID=2873927 RepID=UPI001CA926DF|nr:hypothetical protein [Paenibacillus caui]
MLKIKLLAIVLITAILTSCSRSTLEHENYVQHNIVNLEGQSLNNIFESAPQSLLKDWNVILKDSKIISASSSRKYFVWDKRKQNYKPINIKELGTSSESPNVVNIYTIISEKVDKNNKTEVIIVDSFDHNLNMESLSSETSLLGFSMGFNSKDAIKSNSEIGVIHFDDRDEKIPVTSVFSGIGWERNVMNNDFPNSGTFSMILYKNESFENSRTIFSRLDLDINSKNKEQFYYQFTGSQLTINKSSEINLTNETTLR